ncbi:phospholipase [Pasteurellaceae bacterium LIM206]|nr:phospholipase [Pasteurellaceae bacterium LIM206]
MLKRTLLVCTVLAFSSTLTAQPITPGPINVTLLAEITAKGQKVNGVALEYEDELFSSSDLTEVYQVATSLDQQAAEKRTVLRAYTYHQPALSNHATSGRFVIVELDTRDANADLYALKTENEQPIKVRAKDTAGQIVKVEKVQKTQVPQYYRERLEYQIAQTGIVKLLNGKSLAKTTLKRTALSQYVKTPYLDDFVVKQVALTEPENRLSYNFYAAKDQTDKRPLTIFLHGSGQVGTDNIAHLLSSKGAISTLQYEDGFVLAPQYGTIFDPFDDVNKGQRGGVHWQTENRQRLLLKMIDQTLSENPAIDRNRIYLVGLSRGAEGALNLLQKRPYFFAAALLMSGREANTLDWIDGNATVESLRALKDEPIWFFHSPQDKVSPLSGSTVNYRILKNKLNAPNVKYTELYFSQAGDSGIINANAHNTWDLVFNSPTVLQWLLQQRLK